MCISKVCIGELLHHDHEKNLRELGSKTSGSARQAKAKHGARALRAPRILEFSPSGSPEGETEESASYHYNVEALLLRSCAPKI